MMGRESVLRVVLLALLAAVVWWAGRTFDGEPAPRGLDAPITDFSAARANATLGRLLGPEVPHPVSSDANKAVRDRIRKEFATLGVKTSIYRGLGCNGRAEYGFFACGTTEDILADVAPGQGKAVVLLAHYDSVPAGPGAADDQSGVATILETVRALQARGMKTIHPVLAVISDGEEADLLGAASFLHNPALKARVGVVVNVEARGNQGPSQLFQTSPGDSKLIGLYANNVPGYATSSLFETIYKFLPNDTDLTLFLNDGLTGFNFAFIGELAHYHTALDRRQNLSRSTLQMHGDSMLGVVSSLMQTDFTALKGSDDIYVTLFGAWLPRLPMSWALPLAILAFILLLVAAFAPYKEETGLGRWLLALAIVPVALFVSGAAGWVLYEIAKLVSGYAMPGYAYPFWLRLALAYGVLAAVLLTVKFAGARLAALAVWFWIAGLGIVTAALLPGASPYFVFPALIAAALLAAQAYAPDAWRGRFATAALLIGALAMLLIWMPLVATAENIQGLALHEVFTIPAALGAVVLVPLIAPPSWFRLAGASAFAAIMCAIVAGLVQVYSSVTPQRLNILFVDDHVTDKATWQIATNDRLPQAFRRVMNFSDEAALNTPFARTPSYTAPAGELRYNVPSASIVLEQKDAGRVAHVALDEPDTDRTYILVPPDAGLTRVKIADWTFTPAAKPLTNFGTIIACMTRDCSHQVMELTFASRKPVSLTVGALRYTLPGDGLKLVAARPLNTVPSQDGDSTIIFGKVQLP
ncbi:MAG TPA: M20/M25/M40 family metallo-hydrolase [Rhizomicrobium sp.]|nr:M20/M25/M40 family metallo-hydrolase [Rhizomicrobium sp.]